MCCVAALKLILIALLAFCIIGACLGIGAFKGILYSAPSISNVGIIPQGYATVVYDAQGNESTKLVAADSNRSWKSMDKIPKNLANAFVAIEDERFYQHNVISISLPISLHYLNVLLLPVSHRILPSTTLSHIPTIMLSDVRKYLII